MRILTILLLAASAAHAEKDNRFSPLQNFLKSKTEQTGLLIFTPTSHEDNKVVTQYGQATFSFDPKSFTIKASVNKVSNAIVIEYSAKKGYQESWFDGQKTVRTASSGAKLFYQKLFAADQQSILDLYKVTQDEAVLNDETQLFALRYEFAPKVPEMPKVVLILSPEGKKIHMFSWSFRGQTFVWRDNATDWR